MSVVIHGVVIDSPAGRAGLAAGDLLVSVNGHEIHDVLDYQFYITEKRLLIIYLDASGKPQKVRIRKEEYEDLGLTFDTYLMDEQRHCKNHCIFCFIDQMP
ncbi:MAG TPA: PDZ domain-containing protein, partial [Firmicutes bacterium]|nr:PDZ domain-containing protein [Bacillota bacterium]